MIEFALPVAAAILGFSGLVWSADRFVEGSAALARLAGLPPFIIGLTIVSLGTSAPEILVSLNAALENEGQLAIGNAIGSNLANIGLVLGVTALLAPLPVERGLLWQELPVLALVTGLAGAMLADGVLRTWEGAVLLALLVPVMGYLVWSKKHSPRTRGASEKLPSMAPARAWFWFALGLTVLMVSSRILVWGAVAIAHLLDVSTVLIGLTLVAVGTSLPELAASAVSALRGHQDIALGNVVGSNIFNLLSVMPIPALFHSLSIAPEVFARDYASMALMTALLGVILLQGVLRTGAKRIASLRWKTGCLLLTAYCAYYYWLFQAT